MKRNILYILLFSCLGANAQNGSTESTESAQIALPVSITAEIQAFQKNIQPLVDQIEALETKAKELRLQVQAGQSRLNGKVEGWLIGKEVDLTGKTYRLSEDGKSIIVEKLPDKKE